MMDDFEILIPDSKRIMMEAEQDKSAITMDRLMSHSNPQLATHVSRELYSVLKKKTTGQARSQLKSIGENEGLEAWRLIRANLCRKDGQRLQGEFDTLTSLQPIKIGHFKEFPTLHKRWESELTKFASIDPEYRLGKFQKRNIIYRALPQEIRDDIDREQAHNPELSVYDDLINFIINISRSNKYQKTTLPKPLSANLVGESPSAAAPAQTEPEEANVKYTIDEWIMYMYQDEGQAYIAAGNPLPEEGILALNSVVKGKGKGKGTPQWQKGTGKGKGAAKGYQSWTPKGKGKGNKGEDNKGKGKGKGKDHIQCHGCLEYGHYVRDCPQRSVQMVEDTNWGSDWPSQSGWTGQSSNRVALIVTDQPFTGYRQETVGKKPAHTSNSNITATTNWNFDGSNLSDEHNFHDVETGAHVNEKYVTKIGQKLLKNDSILQQIRQPIATTTKNSWSAISEEKVAGDKSEFEAEFPPAMPVISVVKPMKKARMSKIKRRSHQDPKKKRKQLKSCDADLMSAQKLDKVLSKIECNSTVDDKLIEINEPNNAMLNEDAETPVPALEAGPDQRIHKSTTRRDKKTRFCEDFDRQESESQCSDRCCSPDSNSPPEKEVAEDNCEWKYGDPRPPPTHWKTMLDNAIKTEESRRQASRLPGCSTCCGDGVHNVKFCRAFTTKQAAYSDTSAHIGPRDLDSMSINLLTSNEPVDSIMPIEKGFVWALVPCAVDSGACAHVSPPNIFGRSKSSDVVTKGKHFAADGSPIDCMQSLSVNAVLEGGTEMTTQFDIAKITRPLLSANQIVANGHNLVFGKNESYIQVAGTKHWIYLRPEGKLYMLDMWVKLPTDVARESPFVRQVTQA